MINIFIYLKTPIKILVNAQLNNRLKVVTEGIVYIMHFDKILQKKHF